MSSALSVKGVTYHYGRTPALQDVALDVAAGTFTVLLGVNGAGKTTLFNLVTRLFGTQSGSIHVGGHDLATRPTKAMARMGVVFQSRALDASLTVAQNLIYQGALQGLGRHQALARGEHLLARIGLSDRLNSKAGQLSGGQQRRVEIARALLHQPALILCDEPTTGLDIQSRQDIVTDIHRMTVDDGIGVLWATHLIDEVYPDDPVYVLHKGRILTHGNAAEIAGDQSLSESFLDLTGAGA